MRQAHEPGSYCRVRVVARTTWSRAVANALVHLLQAPLPLANALEAAGAEALGCCGGILDERFPEAGTAD